MFPRKMFHVERMFVERNRTKMLRFEAAMRYKVADMPQGLGFVIPYNNRKLTVIASMDTDNKGIKWEHVSVSCKTRLPTWDELKFVKMLFWDAEDEVLQFFPPQSEYVNVHHNCLHLWRAVNVKMPWR